MVIVSINDLWEEAMLAEKIAKQLLAAARYYRAINDIDQAEYLEHWAVEAHVSAQESRGEAITLQWYVEHDRDI